MKRIRSYIVANLRATQNGSQIIRTHSRYDSNKQIDLLNSVLSQPNETSDWKHIKSQILQIPGNINEKNFDGVLMKSLISKQNLDKALSYAKFLKESTTANLSLGTLNGLLSVFSAAAKQDRLIKEDKEFVLDAYKNLYKKYKVLDSTTCENLLHALCYANEWQMCFSVLENIKETATPSHSAYSTLIATLFKNNRVDEAKMVIKESVLNKRPLQEKAYRGWVDYIQRKYTQKESVLKHLDEISLHVAENFEILSEASMLIIRDAYGSLRWNSKFSRVRRESGHCTECMKKLECLKLNDTEFSLLQKNVRDRLIVGSDLFLKTSPAELKRFQNFISNTGPYDIVLDGLNIAFIAIKHVIDKADTLCKVVQYYKERNKKILLVGRQHMLFWPRKQMLYLNSNTHNFYIDNMSKDDSFFITAAILSGPQTDIVSKDLFRDHRVRFADETLRLLFRRWQWQHQWMVFSSNRGLKIQAPLPFSPCAQKAEGCWHIPYKKEALDNFGKVSDGIPHNWLCLQAPRK